MLYQLSYTPVRRRAVAVPNHIGKSRFVDQAAWA